MSNLIESRVNGIVEDTFYIYGFPARVFGGQFLFESLASGDVKVFIDMSISGANSTYSGYSGWDTRYSPIGAYSGLGLVAYGKVGIPMAAVPDQALRVVVSGLSGTGPGIAFQYNGSPNYNADITFVNSNPSGYSGVVYI